MSAVTLTVTGRGTGDVDYPGHGKSTVAIPGRVTGYVGSLGIVPVPL